MAYLYIRIWITGSLNIDFEAARGAWEMIICGITF